MMKAPFFGRAFKKEKRIPLPRRSRGEKRN
jgi:hypothetical protein